MAVLRKRLSTGNPIGRPKGVVESKPRVRLEFRAGQGPSKAHQQREKAAQLLKARLADPNWPRCACGCGNILPDTKRTLLRGHGAAAKVRAYLNDLVVSAVKAGVVLPDMGILKKARSQGRGYDTFPKAVSELTEFLERLKASGTVTSFTSVQEHMDALHGDLRAFGVALQTLHG